MTATTAPSHRARGSRWLAVTAAAVVATTLLGWSVPGGRWLTSWGGVAASSPWTAVSLLLVAGAALAPRRVRPWLAGLAVGMSVLSLVDPAQAGAVQQAVWGDAPNRPAFGVDVAVAGLAVGVWMTVDEVLDGLPTAFAAGAAAVAMLSVVARVTGQVWLASGGEVATQGAMAFPTIVTVLLLALAVLALDRARPFPLLAPVSTRHRWMVFLAAVTAVPIVVAVAQPTSAPRSPGAYATTALLVVATTLGVQMASVASQHRDALANVVAIVEASPDATLLVAADGRVITANSAAERTFGSDRRDLVGRSVDVLLPADRREEHGRRRAGYMQTPTSRAMAPGAAVVGVRTDGTEFPAEVWLSSLRLHNQPVVAATVRDVTLHAEQISRLQTLREMQETFMMAVSHELRTPLTAITGIVDTLHVHDDRIGEDGRRVMLDRLAANAERLGTMIGDLLDIERMRRGAAAPTEPVDAAMLVADQARSSAAERGVELTVVLQPEVPLVPADPVLLARAVDNLVSNAAKYAPGPVEVVITADADSLVVAVEDHGPGIPVALRGHVFEAFHRGEQLDAAAPGVGIGLALVAGLARSTGGRAWVQERDDGLPGASFRFRLPAAARSASAVDLRQD